QPVAGHPDHLHHADCHSFHLDRGRGEGEGVHDLPPSAGGRHARRVHLARPVPLLHLLGSHADPHVFHHRHLGRETEDLRGGKVLHLYHGRFRAHAGRPDRPLLPGDQGGGPELQHHQLLRAEHSPGGPDLALPCVRLLLRHQGPPLPGTYLVATCPHRG